MPFWLTNPLHGVMPVYTSGDVEKHKGLGWTLLNHGESPNLPPKPARIGNFGHEAVEGAAVPASDVVAFVEVDDAVIPAASLEQVAALEKSKPGRPPKAK